MQLPNNIKTTEANIPALDHHEDFVMRMFFMRYPRKTSWSMCLHLLLDTTEAHNFTRWHTYLNFDSATLVGEMESMLADLRQEFVPKNAKPASPQPAVSQDVANIISNRIDSDLWKLFANTVTPINK
jgi:hypothetical protein